ncbi:MAG: hypothetical protein ACRDU4_05370, partial [Mycobacterium sp.]
MDEPYAHQFGWSVHQEVHGSDVERVASTPPRQAQIALFERVGGTLAVVLCYTERYDRSAHASVARLGG